MRDFQKLKVDGKHIPLEKYGKKIKLYELMSPAGVQELLIAKRDASQEKVKATRAELQAALLANGG